MAKEQYKYVEVQIPATPRNKRLTDSIQHAAQTGGGGGGGYGGGGGSISVDADFDIRAGEGIDVSRTTEGALIYTIGHGRVSAGESTANEDDVFIQNIELDHFGHVTGVKSVRIAAALDDRYLRKDIDDTAHGNITFDKSIGSTVFMEGWEGKGWRLDANGLLELEGIRNRSDIYVGGKIGSPDFASGFTGYGWEIDTKTCSGTIDNWTVRKSMKVYELVCSQIYGLNGSTMITDFNKIKDVTPLGNGRYHCTMDDMDGEMLMNLRDGDIVRVQKRDGWSIRYYYAEVENVTMDTFDLKIVDGTDVPVAGDVCFRMGSKTDTNRQGLIYLTSSDDYASYIDILDDVDSPRFGPDNTKVRIGNLRGLTVNGQPLDMYGIYINGGVFQHSTFYLPDGTTIEQQFEIMDGKLNSTIGKLQEDMSGEEGNILRNSSFGSTLAYWNPQNNIRFINVEGGFLWLPPSFYADKLASAGIVRDGVRNALRIKNSAVIQPNGWLELPRHKDEEKPEDGLYEYSFAFYFRAVTAGTLTAGVEGTELWISEECQPMTDYVRVSAKGKWDEQGDFRIAYTGECRVYAAVMRNDALADAITHLQTGIEQTAEEIRLWAEKEITDSEGRINQKWDSEFKVMADEISSRVTYQEFNAETGKIVQQFNSQITQLSNQIALRVTSDVFNSVTNDLDRRLESEIDVRYDQIQAVTRDINKINNTISTAGWITKSDSITIFAEQVNAQGIATKSYIDTKIDNITISSKNIKLEGYTTINGKFGVDTSGNMFATGGMIGGFSIHNDWFESSGATVNMMIHPLFGVQIGNSSFHVCLGTTGGGSALYNDTGGLVVTNSSKRNTLISGALVKLNIPNSTSSSENIKWIECGHTAGFGSYLSVESRYFGDTNGMERTCINVGQLMSKPQAQTLGYSEFYNLILAYKQGGEGCMLCYEW